MGDFYAEKLVRKKTTGKDIMIKCLMAVLTVIAILSLFVIPFGIFIIFLVIGLDIFIFRSLDVEYEYQYINGDIDIDKIMHKERRKNVFAANIKDMELLAPSGTPQLNSFGDARIYDFTSGYGNARIYEMIFVESGVKKRVLFEPDEHMVEGIWTQAPRKVIRK